MELVTTSTAGGGDGEDRRDDYDRTTAVNPHMKFSNGRRGYLLVTLDGEQLRADYRTVSHRHLVRWHAHDRVVGRLPCG